MLHIAYLRSELVVHLAILNHAPDAAHINARQQHQDISGGLMEAAIKHVKVLARMGRGQSCKFISSVKWRMGILIC